MQGSHTLRHLALITSLQARSRQDASLKDSCRTNDALGCLIYKPNQTKAAWYSQGPTRTNDALGCLRNSSGCSRNTSGCPGRNTSSILTKSQALMFGIYRCALFWFIKWIILNHCSVPTMANDKLVIIGIIVCLGSFLASRYINHWMENNLLGFAINIKVQRPCNGQFVYLHPLPLSRTHPGLMVCQGGQGIKLVW